jgi:hypothetical protein
MTAAGRLSRRLIVAIDLIADPDKLRRVTRVTSRWRPTS